MARTPGAGVALGSKRTLVVDGTAYAAIIANAAIMGSFTNVLGVIYTQQALQTDHATFKTPSMYQVATQVGKSGLVKGLPMSVMLMGSVYASIRLMEKVADDVVIPGAEKAILGLFKPNPAPAVTPTSNSITNSFKHDQMMANLFRPS